VQSLKNLKMEKNKSGIPSIVIAQSYIKEERNIA